MLFAGPTLEVHMEFGHTVKCLTMGMPVMLFGGHPGCRAGNERLAWNGIEAPATLSVSSEMFAEGDQIQKKYTADGQNVSPRLNWFGVPPTAKSLALLVEDPDAPTPNPYVHWIAYNLAAYVPGISEAIPPNDHIFQPLEMVQGKNSALKIGYTGCAPPKGDSPHHYHFQLFALDRMLDIGAGAGRSALLKAMKGHVLAKGEVVGTYQR
jgi:Raf kinase inhibitor-like YbhB/YbcL family protein